MALYDNRFLAIRTENSYGTANGTRRFGEVDDESFAGRYDLVDRTDMSYYAQSKSKIGKEYSDGSTNFAMQADAFLGTLLLGLYGTDTVTGSGDPYTHAFTEAGTLPSFTVEVQRDTHVHTFTGAVLDSFSISASLNEYVMVSAGFVGKAESAVQTNSSASLTFAGSAKDAMHFTGALVEFENSGAASTNVKSINLDWNLNRDTDNACGLGDSTYVRAPACQRRELTGSIEFSKTIYSTSIAEPDYDNLIITNDIIPDTDDNDGDIKCQFSDGTHSLEIVLPKVVYEAPETSVSGRDSQTMSVSFKGLYDTSRGLSKAALLSPDSSAYA